MEENVLRGVALLDEKVPDWRERIDKDKLALEWCDKCIIGQIFGCTRYYNARLPELGIVNDDYGYYGFHKEVDEMTWHDLTDLWKEQL